MADRWHESDDPEKYVAGANRLAARGALFWTLVIGGLIVLVVVATALFQWGTSGVGGRMDAQREKNSADNRVKVQKEFNARYQSIKAMDKNITIAYEERQAAPDDQVKATNYAGLVRNCNDAVGEYNTLARSFLAEEFRDANLPYQIDPTDPETDCKENTK